MNEKMNIYETFNNLRYQYENEVAKLFAKQSGKVECMQLEQKLKTL